MTNTPAARVGGKWGLILGVSVCLWTLTLHALGFYTRDIAAGQKADVAAMLLPVLAVSGALRERMRMSEGIRFAEAIRLAAVLGFVSAALTVPFLWFYHHYVNPRWLDLLVAWKSDQLTAAGEAPADVTRAVSRLRTTGSDGAQAISGVIGSIAMAVGLAVLVTGVVRIFSLWSLRRRRGHAIGA